MRSRSRRAGLATLTLLLAGCGGYDETTVPTAVKTPAPLAAPPAEECDNSRATASYEPQGDFEDGPNVDTIRASDRLVVGVAADSYLLGSRNPFTGRIEGFDIDMAERVAERIFGEPGHVELKVISPADRIPFLQDGTVDIVARNMTINCQRWKMIAFSQEYFRSGQKVLVGRDSRITSIKDLAGKRVCAPSGTTSIDNIRKIAPEAKPVTATSDSECLVKFQNGEADALSTDDTVLAGLAAQDPYAVVLDTDRLTEEPYGIGVNRDRKDLVMLINDVLEKMRRDGSWQESYDTWLAPALGDNEQPRALYGRTP